MAARAQTWIGRADGYARRADAPQLSALPGIPAAPHTATGRYRTQGTVIVDPDGREFIPRGVNIGTPLSDGGLYPSLSKDAGFATRLLSEYHPNLVRLVFMTTSLYSYGMRSSSYGYGGKFGDAAVDAIVDDHITFWLQRVPVVMIESHDLTTGTFKTNEATIRGQVVAFCGRLANRWKNESRVWINTANEPNYFDNDWLSFQRDALAAVRATGATNIVVMDAPGYANDCGRSAGGAYIKFSYDPAMLPTLLSEGATNILAAQHNYGAYDVWTTPAKWVTYVDNVHAIGVPLVVGEVGWNQVSNLNAADIQNVNAAMSCFKMAEEKKVGVLWWAAHFNDYLRLRLGTVDGTSQAHVLSHGGLEFGNYSVRAYREALSRGAK